ncbi:MAG: GGDEF domain-containing protein [Succinivibrionaceae bacterium]
MLKIKYFLIITLTVFCISICYFCLSYYNEFRRFAEENVVKGLYFEQSFVESRINYQFRKAMDGTVLASLFPLLKHSFANKSVKSNEKLLQAELDTIQRNTQTIFHNALLNERGELLILSSIDNRSPQISNYWDRKLVKNAVASMIEEVKIKGADYTGDPRGLVLTDMDESENKDIIFIQPVVRKFKGRLPSLEGFILSEIPFSLLLGNVTLSEYSKSIIRITDTPVYEKEKFITRSNILQLRDINGKDLLSICVNIFYPIESIESDILNSILIQVRTNIFISSVIGISLIICFLFILHSFSKLFSYISQIERNKTVFPAKFFIWEFGKTSSLLHRMKETIIQQIKDIENRNKNLEKANAEVEEANHKLARMNNSLEELVNERTISLQNALELSKNCNNISSVIISQRAQFTDSMTSQEIFDIIVKSIRQFNLKRRFKLSYRLEGEPEMSYSSIDEEIQELQRPPEDSYCYENGCYWFPLVLKEGSGCLIISSPNTSVETDILTVISVFCRDISSFLDNHILRKRLSYWARTDGLTKLGNRVAYDQKIAYYDSALDQEYGLFLIDVNGLKETNDKKGHASGDALLTRVADKLHQVFDKYHAELFRIGGDEFTAILDARFLDLAPTIQQELVDVQDDYDVYVKADRIGVCATFAVGFADSRKVPIQMMYKIADREMYLQKQEHYERCFRLYGEIRKPRH